MPFKSIKQEKFMFSKHPDIANRWKDETPNQSKLPVYSKLDGYFSGGHVVPGKAQVSGDSPKNDKVPIMASPKEVVLPRSVTLSPNAPEKAKEFMKLQQYFEGRKK